MTAPAGIVAREKAARVLADDQRRAVVLARLRFAAPGGLSEGDVRRRLGWQVSVTPTLRELAALGDAHERNGVWFHGPARADAGGQSGVAPATTPPDREAPVSVAVDGGAAADPVPVQDPKTGTSLAERLRAARVAAGLSQAALGKFLGFAAPQVAISRVEAGRGRGPESIQVEAWLAAGCPFPVDAHRGGKRSSATRPPPVAEEPPVADLADPAPGVLELPAVEPTLPGTTAALQPEAGVPAGGDSPPPSSAPSEGVEGETSGGGLDLLRAQLCEILDGDDTWTDADLVRAIVDRLAELDHDRRDLSSLRRVLAVAAIDAFGADALESPHSDRDLAHVVRVLVQRSIQLRDAVVHRDLKPGNPQPGARSLVRYLRERSAAGLTINPNVVEAVAELLGIDAP